MNKLKKILILCFFCFYVTNVLSDDKEEFLIFAPASLRDALEEIVELFESEKRNLKIKRVFLGTSQLAKQITNGANPDIFISANKEWMDFLEEKKLILKNFRFNYLTNSLVVITSKEHIENNGIPFNFSVKTLEQTKTRLSLALINAVPAGIYAKQALKNLSMWNKVSNNIAQSTNVRTAMQFVSRGDLEYGIVYKSDVIAAKNNIRIIHEIDKNLHNEIVYPVAVLNNKKITIDFYNYLSEKKILTIMEKWGFQKYQND